MRERTPTVTDETLVMRLAERAHGLAFDDLPRRAVEQAKDHLVHNLGLALRGHRRDHGRQAVRVARSLSGDRGACSIIGSGARVTPLDAAFANCTLMRTDGLDDVLFPAGIHAGLVTMPVALALGEDGARPGRDVLAAILAGYEVMGALATGEFAWNAETPRRPTAVFGTFGAATVAARLLDLDVEQTAHALGYAANTAMGLAEGEPVTHWYSLLARSGLLGAVLAREGGVAASTVLEGRYGFFRTLLSREPPADPELLGLGRGRLAIEDATVKRYPGTAANIVPIQLAVGLTERHGLTPADVSGIEISLPVERLNFFQGHAPGPFRSRAEATSSVVFWVASVLTKGHLDVRQADRFDDPEVGRLAELTGVTFVAGRPLRYAEVAVTTTDGRRLSAEGDSHVLPSSEWLPWLEENAADLLSVGQLEQVAALVADLDALDDVADLLRALRPADR
jgi:2-methylcitrate dehydratase PrpD